MTQAIRVGSLTKTIRVSIKHPLAVRYSGDFARAVNAGVNAGRARNPSLDRDGQLRLIHWPVVESIRTTPCALPVSLNAPAQPLQ